MIGRDAADGRMRLTPLLRRFDIRWSKAGSAALFADLARTAHELARAAQATPFFALEAGPLGKFITVHPLGGCPMADDPARRRRRRRRPVHGHAGPVRPDGSIVPTALGVNPSKTIAALAERGVERMIAARYIAPRDGTGGATTPATRAVDPLRIYGPATLEELVGIVQERRARGHDRARRRRRALWSDVALTAGFLVQPTDSVQRRGRSARGDRGRAAVATQAASCCATSTRAWTRRGLALLNMGGYDGQTIAGVIATSTHGSGLGFGPFPDYVRSLDLVASGGRVLRFDRGDDGFDAVACGMGCMGIVDSLVLEVRPRFWLRERRVVRTWEEVRPELDDRIATEEHLELFLNPYGGHEVLETTRTEAPEPTRPSPATASATR